MAFKKAWPLTPATSDLYQASLVVLEMHFRAAPWVGGHRTPLETFLQCKLRTPAEHVLSMTPKEAERWAVSSLGQSQLAGELVRTHTGGKRLLELAEMSAQEASRECIPGLNTCAIRLGVATLADQIPEPFIDDDETCGLSALLEVSLSEDVCERPVDATTALRILVGRTEQRGMRRTSVAKTSASQTFGSPAGSQSTRMLSTSSQIEGTFSPGAQGRELFSSRQSEGYGSPVSQSSRQSEGLNSPQGRTKRSDGKSLQIPAEVASTFVGLARLLVLRNDVNEGLATCVSWLGIADSEGGRERAINACSQLFEQRATDITELDISRTGRGHWRPDMLLCGVLNRLFASVWESGNVPPLATVDLSDNERLQGSAILKMVLGGAEKKRNARNSIRKPSTSQGNLQEGSPRRISQISQSSSSRLSTVAGAGSTADARRQNNEIDFSAPGGTAKISAPSKPTGPKPSQPRPQGQRNSVVQSNADNQAGRGQRNSSAQSGAGGGGVDRPTAASDRRLSQGPGQGAVLIPIPTLRCLKLRNCGSTGAVPPALTSCFALEVLDLSGCRHHGKFGTNEPP
jgi:hypothetical protein